MKRNLILVTLALGAMATSAQSPILNPSGEARNYTYSTNYFYPEGEIIEYEKQEDLATQVFVDKEAGKVYIKPFSHYDTNAYIVGTLKGEQLTFEFPQLIETKNGNNVYAMVFRNKTLPGDYNIVYKEEDSQTLVFTMDDNGVISYKYPTDNGLLFPTLVIGLTEPMKDGETATWSGHAYADFRFIPMEHKAFEVPADLQWEEWVMQYYINRNHKNRPSLQRTTVYVATNMEDRENRVYIKGLSPKYPDFVVKGKIGDGKITVRAHQYVGMANGRHVFFESAPYAYELDEDTGLYFDQFGNFQEYMTFTYDKDAKKIFSVERAMVFNGAQDELHTMDFVAMPSLICPDASLPEAKPAKPDVIHYLRYEGEELCRGEFMLTTPDFDINGNKLDTSRLSYIVYFNGYPYTFSSVGKEEIPYSFTDYFFFDRTGMQIEITYFTPTVEEVAAKMVYITKDGKRLESDMAYEGEPIGYDPNAPETDPTPDEVAWSTAITSAGTDIITFVNDNNNNNVVGRYAIDGTAVSADYEGIQIVKLSNGKSIKVINKK